MDVKNYIKVTPKGETRSHVVLAGNKAFYQKHGGKIEEPTEEEIVKAFPELANVYPEPYRPSKKEVEEVVNLIKEKDEQIAGLIADREADANRIATLRAKCEEIANDLLRTQSELNSANEQIASLKLKVEVATPAPKK